MKARLKKKARKNSKKIAKIMAGDLKTVKKK